MFGVEKVSCTLDGCGNGDEMNRRIKYEGSIAERRARKLGFDAAKISTPRFRTSSPLPSPGSSSPFVTIPPGLSPHMLLDSPILLPNSQLSPTTGTFANPSFHRDGQMMMPSLPADSDYNCDGDLSSIFKSHSDTTSLASFSDVQNQSLVDHVDYQYLSSMQQHPVDFEFPAQFSGEASLNNCSASLLQDRNFSSDPSWNSDSSTLQPSVTNVLACPQMPVKDETPMQDDSGTQNSFEEDQKEMYASAGSARTTEDGFNWRKYGQKQVKGSEYPRSYYKCTHPNCQVKKKVERSHDGQITEIIYKNAHNHPKPQPCRKSPFGSLPSNETSDAGNGISSFYAKTEGCSAWDNTKIGSDWHIDGFERPSSASVVTEISDPPSVSEKTPFGVLESTGTPEFSSTLGNYDDDGEDAATPGHLLPVDDDEKEPDSKRRNTETTLGSRALRAPRVVVQIESDVDILDDGYRWRKYGQKVVKGNPNPRSYYKCTSAGCNVRKHVERASHNLKYVITTYEGKHNHEVPAARNSCHANSGSGTLPTSVTNTHPNLPLPQNPHHPKPEPNSQDLPPPFDTRIRCNNDFFRSNFLAAPPPFYQMKYPSLPNTAQYNPFGLAGGHHSAYSGGIMRTITDPPMPPHVGFSHTATSYSNPERMLSSIQPLYGGQQVEDIDVKPIRPKQEQGDESLYPTDMHNVHNSDFDNMMGNFPS